MDDERLLQAQHSLQFAVSHLQSASEVADPVEELILFEHIENASGLLHAVTRLLEAKGTNNVSD